MANAHESTTLLSHIAELRKLAIVSVVALFATAITSFIMYEHVIEFLYRPLEVLEQGAEVLYINTIFEGFLTRLKVSLLAGIVLSFPVHLLNLVRFVFPGLTTVEKRLVLISLLTSGVFIILSFLYSYYKVVPVSVGFLTSGQFVPPRTGMLLSFSGNIFYVLQFMLVALIIFQLPIILEVLMAMNVVSRRWLWRSARYIIVGIFALAAIVTPPDFVTQLGIALPLSGLYFVTILVAKIFGFGNT